MAALAGIAAVNAVLRSASRPQEAPLEPHPKYLTSPAPELQSSAEGELTGGQAHFYSIAVGAGQFLHVVVEQWGVDVVATLVDPNRHQVVEVDHLDGSWGPEDLFFVAGHGGAYRLQIRPWKGSGPGRYRVRIESLRLATKLDLEKAQAAELLCRAVALERQGGTEALREAVRTYETALALWHGLREDLQEAISALRLGRAYFQLGEVATALVYFERSLGLLERSEYQGEEAGALTSAARAYRLTGRPEKALAANQRALEIYRELSSARGQALALNNLAVLYNNLGEIGKALDHYERALDLWRDLGESVEQGNTLHNIGTLYALLGKDAESLDFLRDALKLWRGAGDRRGEAATLTAIGWGHHLQDQPEIAVQHLQEALQLRRVLGDRRGEATTLDRLATVLVELDQLPEALAAYQQAEIILRQIGDRFGLANTVSNLGSLYERQGHPSLALRYFREALPLLQEVGDLNGEAAALTGCARAERARGELTAARAALGRALELLESQGHTSDRLGLRSSLVASRYDTYELYVDLLMELHQRSSEQGWDARALQASERARAQGLLAMLRDIRAKIGQRVEPGLLERRRDLGERIGLKEYQRSSLSRASVPRERRAVLDRELRVLLLELEKLRAEIRRQDPGYAGFTDPEPLTLERAQREVLDDATVLLFFSLGETRSFVWLLTRDSLISRPLPPRQDIEEAARKAHRLLAASHQRQAWAQARVAAATLSEMLLEPLAGLLGSRRLLVVADGALHYIPFGVLPSPTSDGKGGRPLVMDHEIVQVPSLAVLAALRQEVSGRRPAPELVAVVADPVFDARDPRVHGESRHPRPVDPQRRELPVFPSLAHSLEEARAILSLAPPETRMAALDFDASRKTVLSGTLRRYRIIHFATHGLLDTEHPELSGIVLSLVDEEGRPQDGFLRTHEIYDLELPAELVVVSACQTALGKEVRGEGLVGLTGGLMYAGAARVVVSLWSVSDRATTELMRRFYRGVLEQALAPAAALRQAQLSMAQEARWRAPYFWAGFVVLGDWQGTVLETPPTDSIHQDSHFSME